MMEFIVQWATILSPIIAIMIAVWAIKSSNKATVKQMDALKESTTQQVESVKELTKVLIRITRIQLCKELLECRNQFEHKLMKNKDEEASEKISAFSSAYELRRHEERERDIKYSEKYTEKQIQILNKYMSQLDKIMESLGGK